MSPNDWRLDPFLHGLQKLPLAFPAYCFVPSVTWLHTTAQVSNFQRFLIIVQKLQILKMVASPYKVCPGCPRQCLSVSRCVIRASWPSFSLLWKDTWAARCLDNPAETGCLWFVTVAPSVLPITLSATSSDGLSLATCLKRSFLVTCYWIPLFTSSISLITV